MSGDQALSALSQFRGCTYEREDLQQRRLGLIADEVEEAIGQFADSLLYFICDYTKPSLADVFSLISAALDLV